MSLTLFGIDIGRIVRDATQGQLRPGTLIRETEGQRDPQNLAGGRSLIETTHSFEGVLWEELKDEGTFLVEERSDVRSDSRIYIVAESIDPAASPVVNDRILLDGVSYIIWKVGVDPARAGFTCWVRS